MSTDQATQDMSKVLEQVIIGGDLKALSPEAKLLYYKGICESLNLNPLTRPFLYITLNGRLTLYAAREATDQLRNLRDVSISIVDAQMHDGVYVVTAQASLPGGRTDTSTGAVPTANLQGEILANALMKAETKAKRRVTLSICGLGMLDETEVGSIPGATLVEVDFDTGEMATEAAPRPPAVKRPSPRQPPPAADIVDAPVHQQLDPEIRTRVVNAYDTGSQTLERVKAYMAREFGVLSMMALNDEQGEALIRWLTPKESQLDDANENEMAAEMDAERQGAMMEGDDDTGII